MVFVYRARVFPYTSLCATVWGHVKQLASRNEQAATDTHRLFLQHIMININWDTPKHEYDSTRDRTLYRGVPSTK